MRKIFLILALAAVAGTACAQQNVERRRTHSVFELGPFREAKVLQPFGRFVTDTVNIFLRDASLCFLRGGQIYKADVAHVLGLLVDGAEYRTVNGQMGRVVAQRGYNYLLRVTTVDMHQLETEARERQPFFEVLPSAGPGAFIDLDREPLREEDLGFPLHATYYFLAKGQAIPAIESKFRKHVRPEMRTAFKALTGDRFWSWKSEDSLTQLLMYLPE
ncbi:MAG: hypothetical protein IJ722_01680 [Alloprevotella sp.]|nr:hypothetical protein [Alloprevotella sp.]